MVTTALAACAAVYFAQRTVQETQVARREAEEDRKAAELDRQGADADRKAADADRRAAEQDREHAEAARQRAVQDRKQDERNRLRRRLERVGELVEEVFWAADSSSSTTRAWMNARNRLAQALVGLTAQLPQCAGVLAMHHVDAVRNAAGLGRIEVETALLRIHDTEA
jgi:hypothetical protein